ncbi:MAG: DUF5916 domain-containing protein [Bacteroidota bacterium]
MTRPLFILIIILHSFRVFGDAKLPLSRSIEIRKAPDEFTIDGRADEPAWQLADTAGDFVNSFPDDTSFSRARTVVKMLHGHDQLYLFAVCYEAVKGNPIVQSLKRDFSYPVSDAFSLILDPFDDKVNGFSFGVNPYGVQREGLIASGGIMGVSTDWDNAWYAETVRTPEFWTVEMRIPYKTLRFKDGNTLWGVNFTRNDLKTNESSSWGPVPRIYNIATLAFTQKMVWDEAPQKHGRNISLIPFTTVEADRNIEANGSFNHKVRVGGDAKVLLNASLNLDVTVGPDFSQVEVDRQQTNLTRFNLFFPERRNFFIENSDLFASFGFRQIRPFFSRRIGLRDGALIPIIGGFRLSGKPSKDWRVGLMSMQTEGKASLGVNSENFTVAAVQRMVFARSYVSAIVVNRISYDEGSFRNDAYNTVVGMDYNLSSRDNLWNGKAFYHQNITPQRPADAYAHATWLNYSSRTWKFEWNHEYVGKNYQPGVGFVPRNKVFDPLAKKLYQVAYWRLEPSLGYLFFPKSSIVNSHGPSVYADIYFNSNFLLTDRLVQAEYDVNFLNTAVLKYKVISNLTRLFYAFDLTGKGDVLQAGNYAYYNSNISFTTSKRRLLTGTFSFDAGTFFNGSKVSFSADVSGRIQPFAILSIAGSYDRVQLPKLASTRDIFLLGPRFEFTFSRSVFFTSFFQYNTQINNFNINARLQYRFKPMSDLFVVYTENYLTPVFNTRNRAVVLKFVYWINT